MGVIGHLGWNLLYVRDIEVMRHFYVDVVGLPVRWETEGIVAFATGGCFFELMERKDLDNPRVGAERSPLLMSFHVDDLDTAMATLVANGAQRHSDVRWIIGTDAPEFRLVQFIDPEGNLFEICDEPIGWFPDEG